MTDVVVEFLLLSLVSTLLLACVPTRHIRVGISLIGGIALAFFAPLSLVWMLVLTCLSWGVMHTLPRRFLCAGLVLLTATLSLLLLREQDWLTSLGAAYFTLRIMHVALDWWMGRITAPSLADLLSYMLFLPVFIAGPIHRYPNFARELDRRRVTPEALFTGAERVLWGLVLVVVLGGWLLHKMQEATASAFAVRGTFGFDWAMSALGWIELYFVFAGLSAIAIGSAKIIGITIEENFDHPYQARSLVEFWSRWHMTLTHWCRDYVYQPIAMSMRTPALGVFAAMMVLGLWHETSAYYILWAVWQATGIVISHLSRPISARIPGVLDRVLAPVMILGWLSLAKPVVTRVLELWP